MEVHAVAAAEYQDIENKIMKGERLTREDGLRLFACHDLAWLGAMADYVRKQKDRKSVV